MFETSEELIEEVSIQALSELDDCLDMLTASYFEYTQDMKNNELKSIYKQAVIDLKTLLEEYCPEDREMVEEAFEELFNEIKSGNIIHIK